MREPTWKDLFAQGNIIRLIVSNPQLHIQKKPRDFGLEDDKAAAKSGTAGHWKLVSKDNKQRINELESELRKIVDYYSLPFPLVKFGRYIPDSSMDKMMTELKATKEKFDNATDTLIEKYDEYWEDQKPYIRTEVQKFINGSEYDPETTIYRVEQQRPDRSVLKGKFGVQWSIFGFAAPVSKTVANHMDSEGESVKKAINSMMTELVIPIKKRIKTLISIVKKGGRSFTMKSINSASRDCDMYLSQNIFNDKEITSIVTKFKSLLRCMDPSRTGPAQQQWVKELEKLEQECKVNNSLDFLFD